MLQVTPYPFLRLVLFLIAGIGCSRIFSLPDPFILVGMSATAGAYLMAFFLKGTLRAVCLGILGCLLCFEGGVYLVVQHDQEAKSGSAFSQLPSDAYVAVLDEEVAAKTNVLSSRLKVRMVRHKDHWEKATGNVLVYFPVSASTQQLGYGDWLLINGSPEVVPGPLNPGEFDFRQYLSYASVFHRQFVQENQFRVLKNEPPSQLWAFAYGLRQQLTSQLKAALGPGPEFAVASMLVLGVRQTVDNDLLQAYAEAGAMHALAVSGMHVALIFAIFQWFLGGIMKKARLLPLYYLLSLGGIWLFGLITAFSPSVLRAVVMFSVLIIGKWLTKKENVYNSLGFSAFVLLLYDPYMLMNLGFQLSFLAVWSIAYFQPRLRALYKPRNTAIKWIWEVTSVSLAAQIATFPLVLYYFNQFPVYFLLTNLWVIPLGTLILYTGIVFYLFSFWAAVQALIGWLLKWMVFILNKSLLYAVKLPSAVVYTLKMEKQEVLLLFLVLLAILLFFKLKNRKWLALTILASLSFAIIRIQKIYHMHQTQRIVMYSLKNKVCVALIKGEKCKLLADSSVFSMSYFEQSILKPLRAAGIRLVLREPLSANDKLISWEGKTILLMRSAGSESRLPVRLPEFDIVYLAYPCRKLPDVVSLHSAKYTVGQNLKIPGAQHHVWDLKTNGAFVLDI